MRSLEGKASSVAGPAVEGKHLTTALLLFAKVFETATAHLGQS